MIKKKLFIIVGVLLICMTAILFHISGKLPYYYQAKYSFLWNKNEMQNMANKFASDTATDKYIVTCIDKNYRCTAQVRLKNEEYAKEITGIIADEYIELALRSNLTFAWKRNGHLIFSIGSLSKFDKNFQIAYIYYPDGAQQHDECKGEDYRNSIIGHCDVHLNDNWSVYYFAVNLDKYESSNEISNQ